jgi:hypothetical protein
LATPKLLRRAVVVMVGEHPGQQVDDGGIALMAVQTDGAAGFDDCAAEAQLAVLQANDLLGEIDAGEDILADQLMVRQRRLLSQRIPGRRRDKTCSAQHRDPCPGFHRELPRLEGADHATNCAAADVCGAAPR